MAVKYIRKIERIYPCDTNGRILSLSTFVEDVIADGTNTILLVPESKLDTDELLTVADGKGSDLQPNSAAMSKGRAESKRLKQDAPPSKWVISRPV